MDADAVRERARWLLSSDPEKLQTVYEDVTKLLAELERAQNANVNLLVERNTWARQIADARGEKQDAEEALAAARAEFVEREQEYAGRVEELQDALVASRQSSLELNRALVQIHRHGMGGAKHTTYAGSPGDFASEVIHALHAARWAPQPSE